MNNLLNALQWCTYFILVLTIGMLIYHLIYIENMGLGFFIMLPIGLAAILYYGVLSISVTRSVNAHIAYPDKKSSISIFILAILVGAPLLLLIYVSI